MKRTFLLATSLALTIGMAGTANAATFDTVEKSPVLIMADYSPGLMEASDATVQNYDAKQATILGLQTDTTTLGYAKVEGDTAEMTGLTYGLAENRSGLSVVSNTAAADVFQSLEVVNAATNPAPVMNYALSATDFPEASYGAFSEFGYTANLATVRATDTVGSASDGAFSDLNVVADALQEAGYVVASGQAKVENWGITFTFA